MIYVISAENYISKNYFNCDITPRRKVKYYELELYKHGTGITCIGNMRLLHQKNRFICAKPGQIRFSHGNFECDAIHFLCTDPEERKTIDLMPDFTDVNKETAVKIQELTEKLYAERENKFFDAAVVFGILSLAFDKQNVSSKPPEAEKYCSHIMAAKDFIDRYYSEQITLNNISEIAYLSPNFLRVEFEKFIGVSPHRYLLEIRLGNVCKLLKSSEYSLAEIALSCGFKSQSYMNYVFKKEMHMTPREYRNKG